MHYQVYQDTANHWRWRLVAANHRIIADSAESYWNQSDCLSAIQLVKGSASAPCTKREPVRPALAQGAVRSCSLGFFYPR